MEPTRDQLLDAPVGESSKRHKCCSQGRFLRCRETYEGAVSTTPSSDADRLERLSVNGVAEKAQDRERMHLVSSRLEDRPELRSDRGDRGDPIDSLPSGKVRLTGQTQNGMGDPCSRIDRPHKEKEDDIQG